ncbi:MAG: hypothetical protein AAFU49_25025, partial [Pseudomonadota bacterium]
MTTKRALFGFVLGLCACDGRDLGVLVQERPPVCPSSDPSCTPPPPTCDESQSDLQCGVGICERQVLACLGGEANVCTPGEARVEICNGLDDNCDGATDEDDAIDAVPWFADTDGGGAGDHLAPSLACAPPGGFASNA